MHALFAAICGGSETIISNSRSMAAGCWLRWRRGWMTQVENSDMWCGGDRGRRDASHACMACVTIYLSLASSLVVLVGPQNIDSTVSGDKDQIM